MKQSDRTYAAVAVLAGAALLACAAIVSAGVDAASVSDADAVQARGGEASARAPVTAVARDGSAPAPVLAIHGGAGVVRAGLSPEDQAAARAGLERALLAGHAKLQRSEE